VSGRSRGLRGQTVPRRIGALAPEQEGVHRFPLEPANRQAMSLVTDLGPLEQPVAVEQCVREIAPHSVDWSLGTPLTAPSGYDHRAVRRQLTCSGASTYLMRRSSDIICRLQLC